MLWEMLYVGRPLIVLRLQAVQKAVLSASSYTCGMHRQETHTLTHLAAVSAAPARSLCRKAPSWLPRGCKWAARTVKPACNTMHRVQGGSVKNRKWCMHCQELSAGCDKHRSDLRIGSAPGQVRTKNSPNALQKNCNLDTTLCAPWQW